ncbi:hypothetical protein [Echinicola rosea]|nr:hypothetical protein [Echinicola rosea]
MKKNTSYRYLSLLAAIGLVSCSSSYSAMQGETDDLYFMASDDAVVTSNAVTNNTPESFDSYQQVSAANQYQQESFSAKNVNPEYVAKYQVQNDTVPDDEIVYFDDNTSTQSSTTDAEGNVNVYNNFYGYNDPNGSSSRNAWNSWSPYMSMNMMYGPMGFYPGMGMGMGFYDPFWGPGFGFRPGFSMSIGFGIGFGMGGWGYNPYSPFYDPFWGPRYAYGGGFYGGYYGGGYYGRPIIVNNIYNGESRQIVRAARSSRGSTSPNRVVRRSAAEPSTSRALARRSAVSRVDGNRSRSDFSRSENDYMNGRSRVASASSSRRATNSAVMTRPSSSERSRSAYTPRSSNSRREVSTRPSSTSRSRSSYSTPSRTRSTSPSYNSRSRSSSNSRTYSTPSRTRSNSSYTPSRSSSSSRSYSSGSSSRSSGGASRSSGGSRRGGN